MAGPKQPTLPGASLGRALHLTGTILMLNLLLFVAFLRNIDPSTELFRRNGLCQSIRRKERRIIYLSSLILGLEPAVPNDLEAHSQHATVDAQAMNTLISTSPSSPERVSESSLPPKRPAPVASVLSVRPSNRTLKLDRQSNSALTSHSGVVKILDPAASAHQQQEQQDLIYPQRVSDSIYSATIRRSLSLGSERHQSIVLPHIRYSGFMTERLRFSVLSQPWSVVSVVAADNEVAAAPLRAEPVVVEELANRLQPGCSVDSYPGQFPISDGMELSWLAAASQRLGAEPAADEENCPSTVSVLSTSARPYTEV
ncbi:uncharacterized protein BP01DRAFT_422175 [Aspergillus saccharolyticus JOP 1030-1]|uniref:Uncharacterized protein n=1 Tax=Aspergillus saccharolyticus JOP 1030-1 TaxID=1450539 RepID=A0A318ZS43_9EURO|nr:hypothetical protein BP01DRAFT_422175 [Aspergillus saccharolyticus JOP 1030-1]PYH46770.1 hypothetical protein BP01DRAFT_422175 [Aspergillus saccharolyticus JOP 1030-1]